MIQTLRKQFNSSIATNLLNEIQYQRSNYYYFLGKLEQWGADDRPPAEVQSLSEYEDVAIRNNAAYFKKISPNDVTLVCPRYNWTSGVQYAMWDDTKDMEGQMFYVVTDLNEVYKCLDNNNNAASTVKPAGKKLSPYVTADGYTWKYMYTIPSFKRTRFMSVNYIPVQKALSDSFYNNGSIESVSVIQSGSGYSDTQQTFITTVGSVTGSGATATLTVNGSGGIETVTVTDGGSGYTEGANVVVASSIGINAVLTANITAGIITSVNIINPGAGYSSVDTVQFTVGVAVLIPIVSRVTGQILDVIITDEGAGYTAAPTLVINTSVAADIGGLYEGNTTAVLEAIVDDGKLKRVLIRDPGTGYPSSNDTTIQFIGDGFDLALTPVVVDGKIVEVVVENPGYGYTNLTLTVVGTGTGATLRPIYSNSDVASDQSVVEQIAVDGAIYSVVVTEGGTGYNNTTEVVITGDGTGATAHCILNGSAVQQIVMDSWGSGYTRATVSFVDPNRINNFNQYIDAQAYVVLPPGNGHGTDAVKELYSRTVAISSSIRSDPLLTQYQQDYRQFGLIHKPTNIISNRLSTIDFDFNVYKVILNNAIDIVIDEVLVMNTWYRFRVVYIDGINAYLQPLHKTLIEPSGTLTTEVTSSRQYIVAEIVSRPIINKHTGNLVYIANEQPFEFSDTQGLQIKTYIGF